MWQSWVLIHCRCKGIFDIIFDIIIESNDRIVIYANV